MANQSMDDEVLKNQMYQKKLNAAMQLMQTSPQANNALGQRFFDPNGVIGPDASAMKWQGVMPNKINIKKLLAVIRKGVGKGLEVPSIFDPSGRLIDKSSHMQADDGKWIDD